MQLESGVAPGGDGKGPVISELRSFDPVADLAERTLASGGTLTVTMMISPREEQDPTFAEVDQEENRNSEGAMAAKAPDPWPQYPPRFELRDMVRFVHRGFTVEAEVRSVTTYVYREASYFVRPFRASDQAVLGHDHDVSKDEGELERP